MKAPPATGSSSGETQISPAIITAHSFYPLTLTPFYNQSRNDSTFQSITDSSGVTANTTIFGGSKYPGYVNYSKVYNSEGNYFVPGIANYRTNGNGQTLGVGWSATPSSALSLSVGYQHGNNNYSLYGQNGENYSHFQSFFASSNYTLAGFRLGGGFHYTDTSNTFPQILAGQTNRTQQRGQHHVYLQR